MWINTSYSVSTHLRFFLRDINPTVSSHAVKDSIAPSGLPFSANQMTLWYYQKSVDQPVVIESLATIGAVSLAIQHSLNGLTSREVYDYHQDSLHLQAKALRSLRGIIERPSNDSLQMAILSIGLLIYVGVSMKLSKFPFYLDPDLTVTRAISKREEEFFRT